MTNDAVSHSLMLQLLLCVGGKNSEGAEDNELGETIRKVICKL